MDKNQRTSILLLLIEKLKENLSWCGETHIQKSVYFLQELLGVPLKFEFILYKHGPFSFDLNDELTAIRADGLIKLQPQQYPYGPSIILSEEGIAFKSRFPKTGKEYAPCVTFIGTKLGGKKVTELERLATALYVTNNFNLESDIEKRAEKINELKPHVLLDDAREAVLGVDKIKEEIRGIYTQ